MVTLAEDLFLLVCHEASGRARISTAYLDLGLGGALLLNLVLRERITLVDDHVAVVDHALLGDPLLDAALGAIAEDVRSREPEYWVRHLAKGARAAVQSRLVAAGVLQRDDHNVLGVIPVHHTHQIDGRIEHELVQRLHDAVVLDHTASRETAALVSLALAVGLEQHLFPRSDRRAIRRRMHEIADGDWVGAAVKHAIDAVNAALGITAGSNAAAEA
jgi:Golgi phosphoprotein 3 GPP34